MRRRESEDIDKLLQIAEIQREAISLAQESINNLMLSINVHDQRLRTLESIMLRQSEA